MKLVKPRLDILLPVLATLMAPAFVLLGSGLALRAPDRAVLRAAVAPEPPDQRLYLDIRAPMTASMPSMGGILSVSFALALDKDIAQPLFDRLRDTPEPYLSMLTGVMQETGEALGPGTDWPALRAPLAEAMRDRLNDRLRQEGLGEPVQEVLFSKITWAPRKD